MHDNVLASLQQCILSPLKYDTSKTFCWFTHSANTYWKPITCNASHRIHNVETDLNKTLSTVSRSLESRSRFVIPGLQDQTQSNESCDLGTLKRLGRPWGESGNFWLKYWWGFHDGRHLKLGLQGCARFSISEWKRMGRNVPQKIFFFPTPFFSCMVLNGYTLIRKGYDEDIRVMMVTPVLSSDFLEMWSPWCRQKFQWVPGGKASLRSSFHQLVIPMTEMLSVSGQGPRANSSYRNTKRENQETEKSWRCVFEVQAGTAGVGPDVTVTEDLELISFQMLSTNFLDK